MLNFNDLDKSIKVWKKLGKLSKGSNSFLKSSVHWRAMGNQIVGKLWTTLHSIYTQNFFIFKISSDLFVFMTRLYYMSCRIHLCLSYFDFRKANCLESQEKNKNKGNFMQNIHVYGELSTTFLNFVYRPLVIARFQKAVTSLSCDEICSNFRWVINCNLNIGQS